MKGATVRPAAVPALVLCAVLMTSAGAVCAGGEPVAPFPGTSVSGTGVSDTDVEGWQESLPEPSDKAPPEAGAEAAGVAVQAVDAGPSDGAVPDGNTAAENPVTPAGGSRLLRALAEAAKAPVATAGAAAGGERIYAAEGCPRALLRRLLAGAAGEADALSALGIEREILGLCRERQEIVAGLFETEARLSELREAVRTSEPVPMAMAASAVPAPRVEAAGEAPAVARAAASPLRAALGAGEKANEADIRGADTRAAEPEGNSPVEVPPRYAWFSIIGTAGALRAGISDGIGVWFVREGDALPGGATIAAIAGRPPGVRVTGGGESGEATLLPFRARPGGVP